MKLKLNFFVHTDNRDSIKVHLKVLYILNKKYDYAHNIKIYKYDL